MPRSSPVPEWVPPDLPTSPGVYRFLSETGEPLYIGKSVNLRRRVRGYFYGGGPNGRLADMAFLARAVAYRQTGSDLEARLLEARAILNHRPRFNRAIKNRWRGWYLEIDQGVPFPRPRVVRTVRSPSARYFGPYAGRFIPLKISRLIEDLFGLRSCAGSIRPDVEGPACLRFEIGTCPAPCIGAEGVNGYRKRVREAIEVLTDVDRARLMRSRLLADSGGMTDGSQTGREPSAWRRLEWLDELETYRSALERPSYAVRVRDLRMDSILQPDEMVISLIVRRWLESGAPDGAVYDLGAMTDREVLQSTITEDLRAPMLPKPEST
ncbi:MAG: hypothetical protein P8Y26_05685 [Gemmatimonadales bacterium]